MWLLDIKAPAVVIKTDALSRDKFRSLDTLWLPPVSPRQTFLSIYRLQSARLDHVI